MLNHARQCRIMGRNGAAHQFGCTQQTIGALMMVEPSATCINMDNMGPIIGRLIIERASGRHKHQVGITRSAHAHQYPDCHEAIQVWRKVADNN
jgi:hypothetical protein